MSGVVTGDAVVVPLDVARLPSRALAFAVDATIQLLAAVAGIWALTGLTSGLDRAASAAASLTLLIVVLVGAPVTWETLSRGRSPGKAMMGLRVVRDDGGAIRFRHALVRALLAVFVDVWVTAGVVGVVVSSLSAQGKRVGDLLAGTVVVRERVRTQPAPVPAMPAALAPWAATLDLTGLTDELTMTVRSFLARSGELDPAVRISTGLRLAHAVALVISPAPPVGVPSEAYLAAVTAERRRRDIERLRRRADQQQPTAAQQRPTAEPGPPGRPPQPPPAGPFTAPS